VDSAELTEWLAYLTCLAEEEADSNSGSGGRMKWNDD
jgi:hypothetical protein